MEEFKNIQLPEKAFAIIQDEPVTQKTGLILDMKPKEVDTGIVVLAGPDLQDKVGVKVRVRLTHGEKMPIRGHEVVYFRDFESSIYYQDGE